MKNILFILLATILLIGCKKENKIEKNLWKNGGEWSITTWEEKEVSIYNYYGFDYSKTLQNAGTFQFNKDGSGTMRFKDENGSFKQSFTYKNTENTLSIYSKDGYETIFDLDWKKDAFTINRKQSETHTEYNEESEPYLETTTRTVKITCKKRQ